MQEIDVVRHYMRGTTPAELEYLNRQNTRWYEYDAVVPHTHGPSPAGNTERMLRIASYAVPPIRHPASVVVLVSKPRIPHSTNTSNLTAVTVYPVVWGACGEETNLLALGVPAAPPGTDWQCAAVIRGTNYKVDQRQKRVGFYTRADPYPRIRIEVADGGGTGPCPIFDGWTLAMGNVWLFAL